MAGSAMGARRHSPECMCQHCEATGSGYFAQQALLAGDWSASGRLSQNVASVLMAQRRAASAMQMGKKRSRAPLVAFLLASIFLTLAGVVLFQKLPAKLAHALR